MVSFFLSTTLSLALLCICQANLISNVCSQATNPPLCIQTLTSYPHSSGADIRGLGQIIIEKAKIAIGATINAAKSVSGGQNKQTVNVCVETCNNAIDDLNLCSQFVKKFDKKSIGDLRTRGSGALTNAITCDDEFDENEPAQVKLASKTTQDLIDVLVIADNLSEKYN